MAASQTTTFMLANGKEEIKVNWDKSNGEIQLMRVKLPDPDVTDTEPPTKQCFMLRTTDLKPQEWVELTETILRALQKLFHLPGYGAEMEYDSIQEAISTFKQMIGDDDDEDEEDEEEF